MWKISAEMMKEGNLSLARVRGAELIYTLSRSHVRMKRLTGMESGQLVGTELAKEGSLFMMKVRGEMEVS